MSWFFGKKKTSPSTPPEPSTTAANMPNSEGDDFIFIERKSSQKPNLDDSGPGANMPQNPLYPPLLPYSLGGYNTAPVLPTAQEHHLNRQDSTVSGPHMLKGIPFKISPKLDSDSCDNLREYTEYANDVLFQISQINLQACCYDFEVENSVLIEVGLGVEEFTDEFND